MGLAIHTINKHPTHTERLCIGFRMLLAAIALLTVFCSNTIYGRFENLYSLSAIACTGLTAITILCFLAQMKHELRKYAHALLLWAALIIAIYATISLAKGYFGGHVMRCSLILLILFPMLLIQLRARGAQDIFLRYIVNIIAILALVSLLLWLVGPLSHLMPTNVKVKNDWSKSPQFFDGYFGLLFITQHFQLGPLLITRNTGIFTEAPMYAYALVMALVLEVFIRDKARKHIVFLLGIAIITSFSTTGFIALGLIALLSWLERRKWENRSPLEIATLFIVLLVLMAVLCISFFSRLGTTSGATRLDDFIAGFYAWNNDLLFGNGFGASDAIAVNYSDFRSDNTGFSNTLMDVLARGGLAFFSIFAYCYACYFCCGNARMRCAGLVVAIMWIFTKVTYLPLAALMLTLAIPALFEKLFQKRRTPLLLKALEF